jgi:hypothetical protein
MPGKNRSQLSLIFDVLGTPQPEDLPHLDADTAALLANIPHRPPQVQVVVVVVVVAVLLQLLHLYLYLYFYLHLYLYFLTDTNIFFFVCVPPTGPGKTVSWLQRCRH